MARLTPCGAARRATIDPATCSIRIPVVDAARQEEDFGPAVKAARSHVLTHWDDGEVGGAYDLIEADDAG